MKKNLLESKMKLYNDSNVSLANFLDISPQSLSSKKNERTEFKQCEIVKIKERYKLTAEEVNNIFFS